jgi:hypothetical protein
LNVAVTVVAALSVTVHVVAVPLQLPPDHPPKVEPVLAASVSVTAISLLNVALHVLPQLIPAGLLVTVPNPVPLNCTAS